uniref:Uncharacterized protein n=1 Tax=Rhizophora mucronata TaxID=61149 RepID=A0A2P2QWI0_RHIMU
MLKGVSAKMQSQEDPLRVTGFNIDNHDLTITIHITKNFNLRPK